MGETLVRTVAIIVAAGRGSRLAEATRGQPKQYAALGGTTMLARTIDRLVASDSLHHVQVVIHPDDSDAYDTAIRGVIDRSHLLTPVTGGATRQASVLAGLEAIAPLAPDVVLIHDAARPFVPDETIRAVVAAITGGAAGAVPAIAVVDSLKRGDASGHVSASIDRAGLWRAQTPQGFRYSEILDAHRLARDAGRDDFTDDAAIAEWAGLSVAIVPGSGDNIKITTSEDLAMAERALSGQVIPDVRTGTGFDVHRFAVGDHVWLGGLRIPHTHALEGHSDADVALHALTDALLGAVADGDIGKHFPPSDPKWKGAASHLFLEDAARRVRARGGHITNVDLTILCEAPRIGPHRDQMRSRIAEILAISVDRVGVKATTTEGLGFTGRREGIAAMASATVVIV